MMLAGSEVPLSAKELSARLTDVPHATLYRHVRALAEAGWLANVEQRQARGAVEVRFALAGGNAVATGDDLEGASLEDHRRWFGMFVAALLESFTRYSDRPSADPVQDGVRFRMDPLRLDEQTLQAFHAELEELVGRYRGQPEGNGRLFATVSIPDPDR